MLAGKTILEVGTRIRITYVASNDPDDKKLVGLQGEITHPFPGLMGGSSDRYVAGVRLDVEEAKTRGLDADVLGSAKINLMCGDRFVTVNATAEAE